MSAVAVLVACGVRLALHPVLGSSQAYSLFYPVIFACAYAFGRGPAILSVALSAFLAFWIFVEPSLGFRYDPAALTALFIFVVTSAAASYLIVGLRSALHRLADEQTRLQTIADAHAGLFNDLQARVGHHMNLLVGILSFQARGEPDPEMLALLRRAGERSRLIAQTLREMSGPIESGVDFCEFSKSLARRICLESGEPAEKIEVHGDALSLPIDVATSLGVALAECLAWVMQRRPTGVLRIRFVPGAGGVKVFVSHAGDVGSEMAALAPNAHMFRAMIEQIGATVSFEACDIDGPGLGISVPVATRAASETRAPIGTIH